MANLPHTGHPHAFLSTIWSLTFEECLFLGVQGFQLRLLWCRESLEVKATGINLIFLTHISMSFFSGQKFIKIHNYRYRYKNRSTPWWWLESVQNPAIEIAVIRTEVCSLVVIGSTSSSCYWEWKSLQTQAWAIKHIAGYYSRGDTHHL